MTYILPRYHSATAAWSPHCVCERTRKMRVLASVYTSWTCFLRFINTVFGVAGQKVCLFTDLEAADEALSCDPNKEISSTEEWTAAYLYSIYVIGLPRLPETNSTKIVFMLVSVYSRIFVSFNLCYSVSDAFLMDRAVEVYFYYFLKQGSCVIILNITGYWMNLSTLRIDQLWSLPIILSWKISLRVCNSRGV